MLQFRHFFTLAVSAFSLSLLSSAALSQDDGGDANSDSEAVVEEVVVTGSRIARSGFELPAPTTVIDSGKIGRTGLNNIGQVLLETPQIGVGQNTQNDQRSGSRDYGANFIDLRSLGPQRTLVLVDGKRRVSGTASASQVDLTTIPAAMVESVEIISGGTSAIYGADAVSGVVNVKLKDDFEGVVVDARGGISGEGDGDSYMLSLAGGGNIDNGRGNVSFGLTVQQNDGLAQADRDFASGEGSIIWVDNPDNTGPNDGIPDTITIPDWTFPFFSYQPVYTFFDGPLQIYDETGTLREVNPGVTCYDPFRIECQGGPDGYRNWRARLLQTPRDVVSALARFEYELTDDVELYSTVDFSQVTTDFNEFSFFDTFVIQRDDAFLPGALADVMDDRGVDSITFRMNQFDKIGPVTNAAVRTTYNVEVGARGSFAEDWAWEGFMQYGRFDGESRIENTRYESRFFEAIDVVTDPDTGQAVCRSATARANGCVPVNLFDPTPVTAEQRAYFDGTFIRNTTNELSVFGLQVTGEAFELPAGSVAVAAGLEYRLEELTSEDSTLAAQGLLYRTHNGGGPLDADVGVTEAFVEAVMPVVDSLEVEAAARWSDYDTAVGSTVAWKFGLNWTPIDDIRVRGTIAQSVRAPNLNELFSPQTSFLGDFSDPCDADRVNENPTRAANCAALGIPADYQEPVGIAGQILTGGNPELQEETSDSWSAGFVFSPSAIEGLQISVDYWDIQIEDAIQTIATDTIIDRCVDSSSLDNPFCPLVSRGTPTDPYAIAEVQSTFINVSEFRASGIDVAAAYTFPLGPGDLLTTANLVYTKTLEELVDATDPTTLVVYDDQVNGDELGAPRIRGNVRIAYMLEKLTTNWDIRYVGSANVDNDAAPERWDITKVDARTYHDLSAQYDYSDTMTFNAGIRNVLDEEPPRVWQVHTGNGFASYYDNMGRYFYLGATLDF